MPNPATTPQPNATPQQHEYIRTRSSLSILGAFLAILRARFSSDTTSDFPWQWTQGNGTDIVIELGYNPQHELRGKGPGIFLGKTPSMWGSVLVGDRAGTNLRRSSESKLMHGTTQVIAQVVSRKQAECFTLADIVSHAFILSSDTVRDNFQLRDVFNIVEGVPTPYPQDETFWQLPVSVTIEFSERWLQQDAQEFINRLNVYLPTGLDDPEYYRYLSLESLGS